MNLIDRWNAKMPVFWAKVHKISLWFAGLSMAGGVTDYLFQALEVSDKFLLYPEYFRLFGKAMLTASVLGAIISKLTKETTK